MCLTVPMMVEELAGPRARCTALGQERWVDLTLMAEAPPKVGEYVVIHLGFAQRCVPKQDALQSYALFEQIIDVLETEAEAGQDG